jgi:hypothetical protein
MVQNNPAIETMDYGHFGGIFLPNHGGDIEANGYIFTPCFDLAGVYPVLVIR